MATRHSEFPNTKTTVTLSLVLAALALGCASRTGDRTHPSTASTGGTSASGETGGTIASSPGGTGTESTGGSTSTASSVCRDANIAAGLDPLIDDFEDGDVKVASVEERSGTWAAYDDGTGTLVPSPSSFAPASLQTGELGTSTFAVHLNGTGFSDWGGGVVFTFDGCLDAVAYTGIAFDARGAGTVRAAVFTPQTHDAQYGGDCTEKCGDDFGKNIALTDTWQHYELTWDDLTQAGWGAPADFDPSQILGGAFQVVRPAETPYGWDYWIDNVTFTGASIGAGGSGG